MFIHKILPRLNRLNVTFSRSLYYSWNRDHLECDCAGFITMLLKELHCLPPELMAFSPTPKACDFFSFIKKHRERKNCINQLNRYDVLVWKKETIPIKGDTGHILLLTKRPKKISENKYLLTIIEVTKKTTQIRPRTIELTTQKDGSLYRIQWDPFSQKVKETEILGFNFFKSKDCNNCQYPESRCLCDVLPTSKWNAPPIIILRHPSEKKHPLATVPLLKRSFKNLIIHEGETFSPIRGTLIYPLLEFKNKREKDQYCIQSPKEILKLSPILPLILIDGTWKKSKKIIHLNSWLRDLPQLEIHSPEKSRYRLRKQKNNKSLNTLETFSFLWQGIDQKNRQKAKQIVHIMDKFIERQELAKGFN